MKTAEQFAYDVINTSFEFEACDMVKARDQELQTKVNDALTSLLTHIKANEKISAIKEIRAATGWGLLESKTYIENLIQAGKNYAPFFQDITDTVKSYKVLEGDGFGEYTSLGGFNNRNEALDRARSKMTCNGPTILVVEIIAETKNQLVLVENVA